MRKLLSLILGLACGLSAMPGRAATVNVAGNGTASTIFPLWPTGNWNPLMLIDGDRQNQIHLDVTYDPGAEYLLDLGKDYAVSDLKIYPRQDNCCPERLRNIRVSVHQNSNGQPGAEVWGTDLFTDGSNAGSSPGTVVDIAPPSPQTGRWVVVKSLEDPITPYGLQMTELEVYADVPESEVNRALNTAATANQPLFNNADPQGLVDGNRHAPLHGQQDLTPGFAYTINMGVAVDLSRIVIWARQDSLVAERLTNYRVSVHKDNAGQVGDVVWKADMHTDQSNPGSDPGSKDVLTAALDAAGQFKGQYIRITSLDDPVPSFALQMAEVEAYGVPDAGSALLLTGQPKDAVAGVGQVVSFTVAAKVVNGDPALISYKWQKDQQDIPGAANLATYTTPPVLLGDDKTKYRCVVSYPGLPDQTSQEATLRLNLAFHAKAYSNRPLWAPGGWNISMIVDGDRGNVLHGDTAIETGMAYDLDLGATVKLEELEIFPRQDGCCPERLRNFQVSIHKDNAGQLGDSVWSANLFTDDGTNAGSAAGAVVKIGAALDAAGKFEGQWIRILALDDPVPDYFLQMCEVEAYGAFADGVPKTEFLTQPVDVGTVPGRGAIFSVQAKVINGDPTKLAYQWTKDGNPIGGANAASYTTPPLTAADLNLVYRCVVSYPGIADITSDPAKAFFDYNYAKGQPVTSNRPLWGPGGWNIGMIVDGNRANVVHGDTGPGAGFAYEVNLGAEVAIAHIDIYPRQDGCCPERLANFRLSVHSDNNGAIGPAVWQADLFTEDGTNAGSGPGTVVNVTADQGAGTFTGHWVQILALADPVPDYFLQLCEIEVIGNQAIVQNPTVAISRNGNSITITYENGVLVSSGSLMGNYSPVAGATSPYPVPNDSDQKYYRVLQP